MGNILQPRKRVAGELDALHRLQERMAQPTSEAGGYYKGEFGKLCLVDALRADILAHVDTCTYGNLPVYKFATGKVEDVVVGGRYMCAYFVTSRLHHFHLLPHWDGWVYNMPNLLRSNGWTCIDQTRREQYHVGVIIYEEFDKSSHTAFYIGNDEAVSNARHQSDPSDRRGIRRHHWLYEGREEFGDGPRHVESFWVHPLLGKPID